MASINKVILVGRFGKDPEVTTFENGNKKVSVTLATSERYRDRDSNWVEQTEWHNIVVFSNLAQDIAEGKRNYSKGDLMYVEGKLRARQYTDHNGQMRNITEVVAEKMMQLAPARPPQQSSFGSSYEQSDNSNADPFRGVDLGNDGLPF